MITISIKCILTLLTRLHISLVFYVRSHFFFSNSNHTRIDFNTPHHHFYFLHNLWLILKSKAIIHMSTFNLQPYAINSFVRCSPCWQFNCWSLLDSYCLLGTLFMGVFIGSNVVSFRIWLYQNAFAITMISLVVMIAMMIVSICKPNGTCVLYLLL